jgi:hypothetical protein
MLEPPVLLSESNRQRIERRSIKRTNINKNALMFVGGRMIAQPCLVRDVAASSVGIRLNGLVILPTIFELSFDGFRSSWTCDLVWREADLVGAKCIRKQSAG